MLEDDGVIGYRLDIAGFRRPVNTPTGVRAQTAPHGRSKETMLRYFAGLLPGFWPLR